jgi:lipopolysaccharide heptosyltransferase II
MVRYPDVKKILIIKPSSLGDIIHSLPAVAGLKKLYPQSYIAWFVFEHFKDILRGNSCLDEIISWRKGDIYQLFKIIRRIRDEKFDLVIDLQGLARTAFIACLSKAKYRIGCPGLKEFSYLFVKEVDKFDPKLHAVDRNLKTVEYLGLPAQAGGFTRRSFNEGGARKEDFIISVDSNDEIFADEFLKKNGFEGNKKLVGIAASAGIPQKNWPEENFARFSDRLIVEHGCNVIFFGLRKDEPVVGKITGKMECKPISAVGKTTLKQLAALIKRCAVFVGNDTGTLHLASALDVLSVGLYGPSNIEQLSPYHPDAVVIYKGVQCSPCGTRPGCKSNDCMKLITVKEVMDAVIKQFNKK